MHTSPSLLGAIAAVLVTGVACGAELGTVPPMRQAGLDTLVPKARTPAALWEPRFERPAQDQYPIDTPEGRFEVHELSDRGLYRTARFSPSYAYVSAYVAEAHAEAPVAQPPGEVVVVGAEEPLSEAPALASAGSRIIDVAAELAAREPAIGRE